MELHQTLQHTPMWAPRNPDISIRTIIIASEMDLELVDTVAVVVTKCNAMQCYINVLRTFKTDHRTEQREVVHSIHEERRMCPNQPLLQIFNIQHLAIT